MEFDHRPFVLHGLLLFFCVLIFLIHPGEEFVEFFFLLDLLFFIRYPIEGLIILCKCFYSSYRQSQYCAHIIGSLLGFVLALPLFRIVGIALLRQPTKSRHSPDTSPDSTAEDATVISINRRFSFFCLLYSA